jgi:non-specific serine/threonine protein kinase
MGGELFESLTRRAEAARTEVRARLGDEAFSKALAEGRIMSVKDVLAIPQPAPLAAAAPAPAAGPFEPLTVRELDVLRLLAQDLSNPEIAERLVVSRRTVEAHLRSIYGKFGVKSREAAKRYALEHGLLEE